MKYITVFFDYESVWGMPNKYTYDVVVTTKRILKVLKKYRVKAVFNICGIIIKESPVTIQQIYESGHEISVHGYKHEDFSKLSISKMNQVLEKSEKQIKKITGNNPVGFRAPYLYDPYFYTDKLYNILRQRGYRWASNRQITQIEEKIQIGGIPKLLSNMFLPLLNRPVIFKDRMNHKTTNYFYNLLWLFDGKTKFNREGLTEIPLTSTMDCFLLGLPRPENNSPDYLINKSCSILKTQYQKSASQFNLNFHDWIIGTANRIDVLDNILEYITTKPNTSSVTATQLINLK